MHHMFPGAAVPLVEALPDQTADDPVCRFLRARAAAALHTVQLPKGTARSSPFMCAVNFWRQM